MVKPTQSRKSYPVRRGRSNRHAEGSPQISQPACDGSSQAASVTGYPQVLPQRGRVIDPLHTQHVDNSVNNPAAALHAIAP